ncbi:MAG TPA: hypothetical protein VIK35_04375 [Verrucomicrobiae bacterium]
MKTPREILFARHENVEPKLDAIRREIVGQASRLSPFEKEKSETGATPVLLLLWRELIFPCRRIWTGLAAVWILIFAVNFSQRDPAEMMARKSPAPSPEMILAFRQQEKLLAELIGSNEPRIAEPQKSFSPRPSSERRFETLMT